MKKRERTCFELSQRVKRIRVGRGEGEERRAQVDGRQNSR